MKWNTLQIGICRKRMQLVVKLKMIWSPFEDGGQIMCLVDWYPQYSTWRIVYCRRFKSFVHWAHFKWLKNHKGVRSEAHLMHTSSYVWKRNHFHNTRKNDLLFEPGDGRLTRWRAGAREREEGKSARYITGCVSKQMSIRYCLPVLIKTGRNSTKHSVPFRQYPCKAESTKASSSVCRATCKLTFEIRFFINEFSLPIYAHYLCTANVTYSI